MAPSSRPVDIFGKHCIASYGLQNTTTNTSEGKPPDSTARRGNAKLVICCYIYRGPGTRFLPYFYLISKQIQFISTSFQRTNLSRNETSSWHN